MKKYLQYVFIIIILIVSFNSTIQVEAAIPCTAPNTPKGCTDYYLLAPLPNPDNPAGTPDPKIDPTTGFGSYLSLMIKIFIGLCAVLSVVMIVIGGLEVMTSELSHTKEAGKERVAHAILGLLIALGAYALLYTINPDLLKSDIKIENTTPVATTCNPPQILENNNCVTQTWYFEYQSTVGARQNFIMGPFTPKTCNDRKGTVSGTIIRPCFSSNTTPTTTQPTWYFRYRSVVLRQNLVNGPFITYVECENTRTTFANNGNATIRCFSSETPPTP